MDGTFTILRSFAGGADGNPIAVLQATDGNLYGATSAGGGAGNRIFRMALDGTVTTLYTFAIGQPVSRGLIQASDGNLYFVGYNYISRMTLTGDVTVLHTFQPNEGAGPQGLVQGADGTIYGATAGNGAFGGGTVFGVTLDGALTVLYAFSNLGDSDGRTPLAPPLQARDGSLYGTTSYGGGLGKQGVVYRLTLDPVQPGNHEKGQPRSSAVGFTSKARSGSSHDQRHTRTTNCPAVI